MGAITVQLVTEGALKDQLFWPLFQPVSYAKVVKVSPEIVINSFWPSQL